MLILKIDVTSVADFYFPFVFPNSKGSFLCVKAGLHRKEKFLKLKSLTEECSMQIPCCILRDNLQFLGVLKL